MKLISAIAALVLAATTAFADDHSLSTITGTNTDLKVYDHTMAGSVRDFVVWGSVDEASGRSELIMRRDGQNVTTTFSKPRRNRAFGGTVSHVNAEGRAVNTNIQFVSYKPETHDFSFSVNGDTLTAKVTFDEFQNNHFKNPNYTVSNSTGELFSFKLTGEACPNYSLHLLSMMIAAQLH